MSEDVSPQSPPASTADWKRTVAAAAAFGAAFAIVLAISAALAVWLAHRPRPWTSTAITAKPTHLVVETTGEELHFQFRYALTNHTNSDYIVVGPQNAALMKKIPEDSSLQRLDGATWDDTIRIPAGQSVNVVFDVPIRLSDYNTTAADLNSADPNSDAMPAKYSQFIDSRLREINGMVLIDYANHYRIDMPKSWDVSK